MAYTTEAAVRAATGFSNATNITTGTMTVYIADADSVINSKIGDVYALPLTVGGVASTPDIIEMLSRHITTALLYFNEYGEESENLDKGFDKKMKWAMGILEDIRKRITKLRNSSGTEYDRVSLQVPVFKPTNDSSDPDSTADDNDDGPQLTMNKQF